MNYAGMPETTENIRTDECGCQWVYCASTAISPQGWRLLHSCEDHQEGAA